MHVISASRRTDIPAFYTEWLMNRVRAGFCHWLNPFSSQVYRVSLDPQDVIAVVLWTRNPAPLLPHLPDLAARGLRCCAHVTLTGYGPPLETHNPAPEAVLRAFERLAARIGPDYALWRYDPIVISSLTPPAYHLERFASLAARLDGVTRRCTVSFVTPYGKVERNLRKLTQQHGIRFDPPEDRRALLAGMVQAAAGHGIRLYSCCEDDYRLVPGMERGRCVDPDLLARLTGDATLSLAPRPTRPLCGCVESVDIGAYDTCVFGCAYCYATHSRAAALRRTASHDPADSLLMRPAHWKGIEPDSLIAVQP